MKWVLTPLTPTFVNRPLNRLVSGAWGGLRPAALPHLDYAADDGPAPNQPSTRKSAIFSPMCIRVNSYLENKQALDYPILQGTIQKLWCSIIFKYSKFSQLFQVNTVN